MVDGGDTMGYKYKYYVGKPQTRGEKIKAAYYELKYGAKHAGRQLHGGAKEGYKVAAPRLQSVTRAVLAQQQQPQKKRIKRRKRKREKYRKKVVTYYK